MFNVFLECESLGVGLGLEALSLGLGLGLETVGGLDSRLNGSRPRPRTRPTVGFVLGLGLEPLSLESKPAIEIEKFHMRSIRDMRSLDRIVTMLP